MKVSNIWKIELYLKYQPLQKISNKNMSWFLYWSTITIKRTHLGIFSTKRYKLTGIWAKEKVS